MTIYHYPQNNTASDFMIGIARARFNSEIGDGLLASCLATLKKQGVADHSIECVSVPGALEIPLALQRLAQTGRFHALIALGAVIRGDTYHFEIVCNDASRGLMDVELETGIPIANGILTCNTDNQAIIRMAQKGEDCALAALEMAHLLRAIAERRV